MIEQLFAGRFFRVGVFRCPPDAPPWNELNEFRGQALAVFPATSVVIEHQGHEPVLANPNHVMFYSGGQRYRRRLHDPRGDVSVLVAPSPRVVDSNLPFVQGPCSPEAFLAQHEVVRHIRTADRINPDFVEETLRDVLARVISDAFAVYRIRRSRRPATRSMHHKLVERAKALLTERPTERWTLSAVAAELHTSEFHLARIFRASTGFTLHAYRNQLRLRLAVDVLDDDALKVGELAHGLGYASHSHFTDSFSAAFGAPPSAVRGALGPRSSREVDRIVDLPIHFR
jgi:AraC family transcriptional regulator